MALMTPPDAAISSVVVQIKPVHGPVIIATQWKRMKQSKGIALVAREVAPPRDNPAKNRSGLTHEANELRGWPLFFRMAFSPTADSLFRLKAVKSPLAYFQEYRYQREGTARSARTHSLNA